MSQDVQGNMNVSRNITVGTNANINGNTTIGHNLKVNGWLEAPNIKGPMKGLFKDEASLKSAYPTPDNGWMALVGNTLPADVWRAEGGKWTATGQKGGTFNVDFTQIEADITKLDQNLETNVDKLTADVSFLECSTPQGTAAKTVANPNFKLSPNCRLVVKMTNSNTVANATLNVNGTGAKPLFYDGDRASASNHWNAGEVLDIYYDGSNFQASKIVTTKDITEGIKGAITSEITEDADEIYANKVPSLNLFNNFWRATPNPSPNYIKLKSYFSVADGKVVAVSSKDIKVYAYDVKEGDVVKAFVYGDSNRFAALAFSKPDGSVEMACQGKSGCFLYETRIPSGVNQILVSNQDEKGIHHIAIIGDNYIREGSIDELMNNSKFKSSVFQESLIVKTEHSNSAGSSATYNIDISKYPIGTQFKLIVKYNDSYVFRIQRGSGTILRLVPNTGSTYYFEKTTEDTTRCSLYHATSESIVKVDFELYTVRELPLLKSDFASYTRSKQSLLPVEDWISGYWQNNAEFGTITIFKDDVWICTQVQFTQGHKITVNCDYEKYVVQISVWKDDMSGYTANTLSAENNSFELTELVAWQLSVRRSDRKKINEMIGEVLSEIDISFEGEVFEKPATKNDLWNIRKNLKSEMNENVAESLKKIGVSSMLPNPFQNAPHYYHFAANGFIKDPSGRNIIPSQSIADVEIAARLGFKYIEANIHQTADGHFVCIHGSSGTNGNCFGPEVEEPYQTTNIADCTLEFIKQNVRYRSDEEKYRTAPPSLEEFCEACKNNNIGIMAGISGKKEALDICIRILGDNVLAYGPYNTIREDFAGYIIVWNNNSTVSAESLMANAVKYGKPYVCGLGANTQTKLKEDGTWEQFIADMHARGFYLNMAGVYQKENEMIEGFKSGIDNSASGHQVNPFTSNYELFDIDSDDQTGLKTTGKFDEGVLTLSAGQTLECGSEDIISLGKGQLDIKFIGSLKLDFGSLSENYQRNITSENPNDLISLSDYFFRRKTKLKITAQSDTTINYLVYKTSRC